MNAKAAFLFLLLLSVLSFVFFLLFLKETYLYEGSIHLAIFSLAMYLLWKKDLRTTLGSIGLPGDIKRTALFTVAGLAVIFSLLIVLGLISLAAGFNDQAKIAEKVSDLPLYLLLLAIVLAPITEELLFRAALVPRIGIVLSSLVFGLLHLAYGSVLEVVGVFFVGIILAGIYRMSKSITPCIIIHFIYNLLSIMMMRFLT